MVRFFAATARLFSLAGGFGVSLGCAAEAADVPAGAGRDRVERASASGRTGADSPASHTPSEQGPACGRMLGGVQPTNSVATNHRVLWRLPTPQAALVQGIARDSVLYLRDNQGSIWRLIEGETEATLLYSQATAADHLPGQLVADGQFLYWGEAVQLQSEDTATSRLLRMLETGGPVSALAESADAMLGAFGADDNQLFVSVGSSASEGLALLDKQGGELSPLGQSLPIYFSRQVGAAIYWTDGPLVGSAPANLLRAELPAFEPQVAMGDMRGPVFDVGPDYVLTRRGSVEDERLALLGQNFAVFEPASGCTQVLPGNGDTISFRTAQDETHVYWLRHVGGYTFSPDAPPTPPETPLYRTDVRSGVTEHIETPGFIATFGSWIIAQDSQHVYLDTPVGVVAIEKP